MKKYLDTSNLVKYQSGKYQGKYDWSNNIGKELYFEYDEKNFSIIYQKNLTLTFKAGEKSSVLFLSQNIYKK